MKLLMKIVFPVPDDPITTNWNSFCTAISSKWFNRRDSTVYTMISWNFNSLPGNSL